MPSSVKVLNDTKRDGEFKVGKTGRTAKSSNPIPDLEKQSARHNIHAAKRDCNHEKENQQFL